MIVGVDGHDVPSVEASEPAMDPADLVRQEVLRSLTSTWEHGWQPVELIHVVRRRLTQRAATWLGTAISVEARSSGAAQRAPQAWLDQLDTVTGLDHELLPSRGATTPDEWVSALSVLGLLRQLPVAEPLLPLPSAWGARSAPPSAGSGFRPRSGSDPKLAAKVRALLAKAESTEFAAEAETYMAKAEDLITRYALDEALLRARAGDRISVLTRRVLIDNPYSLEKATLLTRVAEVNRAKAVYSEYTGGVSIVGVESDLDQIELLFTSLLIQASRAMTEAGSTAESNTLRRSAPFRRSFLSGYAVRIGQRLAAVAVTATDSYGAALVPVLARQQAAVDGEFERLFPRTYQNSGRGWVDTRGWAAGVSAADRATWPAGQVGA